MGQCYTFNSGADGAELLTTPKGGAGNGLEVMLDVQQDEYLPVWKDVGAGACGRLGPPGRGATALGRRGGGGPPQPWGEGAAARVSWNPGLSAPSSAEETPFEAGVRVQIHTQEEAPIIDQLGFGAAPGCQVFVSCQQQQVSSPQPPGPSPAKVPHPRPHPAALPTCPTVPVASAPPPAPVAAHILPGCPLFPKPSLTSLSTAELPATTLGRLQLRICRP